MASITGRVFYADGTPRAGVRVSIATGTSPYPEISAETDRSGSYSLGDLKAGTYVVRADQSQAAVEVGEKDEYVSCDLRPDTDCHNRRPVVRVSPHTTRRLDTPQTEAVRNDCDDDGPEATRLDIEEDFLNDPYDRDVDPVETGESAPVGIGLLDRGLVYAVLSIEIARGVRDVDQLTDKAWRTVNPTEDFPISTGDPEYGRKSAEWLFLRREIVQPLVADNGRPAPRPSSGGDGPLDIVSARMPRGSTHRLSGSRWKFGVSETIEALSTIASTWHQRHPDVDLMIRDISREGGGSLQPPHRSHRCGLDADLQLWVGRNKVCMKHPRYSEWRPLMQELIDVVHSNDVLPVKIIGFSDRDVTRVSNWSGHTCHAHVRFCAPISKLNEIEAFIAREYAEKPRRQRPTYRCR